MSVVAGFFIFVAIIAITAILFGGWVIVSIVRLLVSAITNSFAPHRAAAAGGALPSSSRQSLTVPASHAVRCSNSGCLASNPADARFCRRCGHGLPAATRVQVRRAAVW